MSELLVECFYCNESVSKKMAEELPWKKDSKGNWMCVFCKEDILPTKQFTPPSVPWERRAYNFARNAHAGQLDDSGKDYFDSHILQAVLLVKQITDNPLIITTTYLHDTLEDTSITYEDLQSYFLDPVADWVMELTHEGQKDTYGYYFPRLKTKECIIIKFADRLSNISRMEAWNEKRQQQYLNKSVFWKDGSDKEKD